MATQRMGIGIIFLLFSAGVSAQSSVEALGRSSDAAQKVFERRVQSPVDTTKKGVKLDVQPEFPGGMPAMYAYLRKKIRYPSRAFKQKVQGTVYVQFIVAADGSVRNAEVLRGVREDLDKEALRAVMRMPPWKPGMLGGKPVNARYTIPVAFVQEIPAPPAE